MGSHGSSQVLVSWVGCLVSRGIIVPFLFFVVVLVVSPVRCILSTLVGCFAYPAFSHSPAQASYRISSLWHLKVPPLPP
jgi:hypothetical protein